MPARRDEVHHPVNGSGQRRPMPEQREHHHVGEQRREVRYLQRQYANTVNIHKRPKLFMATAYITLLGGTAGQR